MQPTAWAFICLLLLTTACQGGRPAGEMLKDEVSPKYGGALSISLSADPFQWDPTFQTGARGMEYTFNRLLSYKVGPDVPFTEAVLQPELAERWEVSPDAQTFTFHLRKGAKFANLPPVNGREVVAADVKFSLEYADRLGEFKDLGPSQAKDYTQGLVRVDAPNPYTAVVHFKEPSVPFLNYTAAEWLPVLAREVYQTDGHFKETVVGSGPYQLDRAASQKGTRWIWRKNATYWDSGKPYIDEVRFLVLPAQGTAFAAFQTKQLDVLGFDTIIGYNEAQQLRADNPSAIAGEYEPYMMGVTYMNTRVKPLDDIRIRQAIMFAINNEEMLQTFQGGKGSRLMPGIFNGYFTQEEIKKLMPHDPERARRLVGEAGYPQGVDLEMTFDQAQSSWYLSFIQLFQAQLKKANINLQLKPLEGADFSRNRRQGNYTLNIQKTGSPGSLRYDPDKGLSRFHSTSDNNYWGIKDPVLDRLIEGQRKEIDPAKRRDLIRQAGTRIAEMAYSPDFFAPLEYAFWHPHVKNLHRNVNSPPLPINDVWLDK